MPYPKFHSQNSQTQPLLEFHGNDYPTIGVELEIQLIDPLTGALRSGIIDVLGELDPNQAGIKRELMQCTVEVVSEVCRTARQAREDLIIKYRALEKACERCGLSLLWCGTHPFSPWMNQDVSPGERYAKLVDLLQDTARRIVTFSMHVHVGVDSGDKAIMVMDRLMRYLSTLLALSVNSPFWNSRYTGLHSQRIKLMEQLPAAGSPPFLRNYSEYCWVVNQSIQSGFINSLQEIWWDVRPHPGFGTVEVRIFDLPPRLEDAIALAALTQCLVAALSDQIDEGVYQHDIHPIVVRQNKWKASRFGLHADLIDPVTHRGIPVRDMTLHLHQKLQPYAEKLDCVAELNHLIGMIERPSGAENQLELYKRHNGNLRQVVHALLKQHPIG